MCSLVVALAQSVLAAVGGLHEFSGNFVASLRAIAAQSFRARVLDGLSGTGLQSASELAGVIKKLANRWFVMRDVHAGEGALLLQPRWAMSFLRGPMTRNEIRMAREGAVGSLPRP